MAKPLQKPPDGFPHSKSLLSCTRPHGPLVASGSLTQRRELQLHFASRNRTVSFSTVGTVQAPTLEFPLPHMGKTGRRPLTAVRRGRMTRQGLDHTPVVAPGLR